MSITQNRILQLNMIFSFLSFLMFSSPLYAGTACQDVQQRVDWYLKNPPQQYCKYTPELGETEIKIWRDCDFRPEVVTTHTYSTGSVDHIQNATTICCSPTGCSNQSYIVTYYNTLSKKEFCDGHVEINESPYGSVPYRSFSCAQATCNNPTTCPPSPIVELQRDCSPYIQHTLYTTISIPADCNKCFGSSDPCCGNSDPCCGNPDPCCGDPSPNCLCPK